MAQKAKIVPRTRGTRALRGENLPVNAAFKGAPMWRSFLDEVDIVLKAALQPEEWERLKA